MKLSGFVFGALLIALCAFVNVPTHAEGGETKIPYGEGHRYIEFRNDNDFWIPYGTDRYYTNGLFAKVIYPGEGPWWPGFMDDVLAVGGGCGKEGEGCAYKSRGYGINQFIFTPRDIAATDFQPADHPYAGYLSVSALYHADMIDTGGCTQFGDCVLNEFEAQLGVIGEASLAKKTQIWWHTQVLHIERPNGWEHQLKNDVGGLLRMKRAWPVRQDIAGLTLELAPYAEAAAGNLAVYGQGGAQVKLTTDANDEPGRGAWARSKPISWQVFAGASAKAVALNHFITGNTRTTENTLSIKNFVGEVEVGGALRFGFVRTSLTIVARSKEFPGQDLGHLYGIARLGFVY